MVAPASALAAIPFYLPFIVPFAVNVVLGGHLPTVATGLVERLMMLLEIALLAVLGVWAHRAATAPTMRKSLSLSPVPH